MVNVIDAPIIATNNTYSNTGKIKIRSASACICAVVCLTGALSSASVPSSHPIYSSKIGLVSTNPTQSLVYDNGGLSVYLTSAGDATVNPDVRRNLGAISELAQLKSNWDNNGAEAFSAQLIARCRNLVNTLTHQPDIFPTAQASIQFEWENEIGDYLEIELFENEQYQMALRQANGTWIEQEIDYTAIGDCVEKFFTISV